MSRLLIEIGTEEIPSGYILPALEAFRDRLMDRLTEHRITHGDARIYGTPRRLAVIVEDVSDRQASVTTDLTGPPERVAFDEQGNPTVAARKFAEKAGIPVSRLSMKDTEKGRYLCAQVTHRGQATAAVLRQILPDLILSIPFPKTIRWGDLRIAFAGPIHSIVALLGKRAVSFAVGDVKSGRYTFGHRFMNPGKIRLAAPEQYLEALASADVLADLDHRRTAMLEQMEVAVKAVDGIILEDQELVETNNHLVELPEVVLGRFEAKFLELPREILVTAMREHQRYFAVVDRNNRIMPYFVSINNTRARDMQVVASGHERVLKARLEDARFFYNQDLKTSLDDKVERLRAVLFQAELGTVFDKIQRVRHLGAVLCDYLSMDAETKRHIDRAAWLCKADLVSQVVIEFPKLQGIMGRIYAEVAGEQKAVATAIEEHYRPVYSGGLLPQTDVGAVLSIADKLDTMCGCFYAGLVPTGASDPYALRRQGIGIILTMLENGFEFSLSAVIDAGIRLFGQNDPEAAEKGRQVHQFLQHRMTFLLEDKGIPKDLAASVLSADADNICDVWRRAAALQRMKSERDFQSLAAAFKRVVNIIRKAEPADIDGTAVEPGRFAHPSESALHDAYRQRRKSLETHLQSGDIDMAFSEIAGLKPFVDAFFDEVLVMDQDPAIRKNRLALLKQISDLFARLADFSKIST